MSEAIDAGAGRPHFEVLDSLRGVAAGMVLLGHTTILILGPDGLLVPRKALAVVFFFMLSGFVVSSAYETRLRRGMTLADFMLRRAIRLYPLILLGVSAGSLFFCLQTPGLGTDGVLATALGFLVLPSPPVPFSFGHFPIDPPEWSLFFEMLAYGVYAAVRMNVAGLISVIASSFIGFVLVNQTYFQVGVPLGYLVFEAAASFFGGVLLWRLFDAGVFPRPQVPSWILGASVVITCLVPAAAGPGFDYAATALIFPAILVLGAARGRAAGRPAGRLLGDLSYPVYVLHWPVVLTSYRLLLPSCGGRVTVIVALIAATGLSWLALRFFDQPVRAWLVEHWMAGADARSFAKG